LSLKMTHSGVITGEVSFFNSHLFPVNGVSQIQRSRPEQTPFPEQTKGSDEFLPKQREISHSLPTYPS
jgi:hypothetical protein